MVEPPAPPDPAEAPDDAEPPPESGEAGYDNEAPSGPTEDEENAFIAEARTFAARPVATTQEPAEEAAGAVPAMDELVKRIPAEVLGAMDELFRARFVKVERVPKRALKR